MCAPDMLGDLSVYTGECDAPMTVLHALLRRVRSCAAWPGESDHACSGCAAWAWAPVFVPSTIMRVFPAGGDLVYYVALSAMVVVRV